MFSFFKRSKDNSQVSEVYEFNHELIGCALAYEVARADGNIDINELNVLKIEIEKKSSELNLNYKEVMSTIELQSSEMVSFNEFINMINKHFSYGEKLELIKFLWKTAYADKILEVDEERLIRRISDMINIKDMQVLKLKHEAKDS